MKPLRLLPIAIWTLAIVSAGLVVMRGPGLQTDLAQFLPQGANERQHLLLEEMQRGPASRLIIVALADGEPTALARASDRMAKRLRASEHFERILNGSYTDTALDETLFRYRYLLTDTLAQLDGPGLRLALERRLDELSSQTAFLVDEKTLPADPLAAYREIVSGLGNNAGGGPRLRHDVWFNPEGKKALLLLTTDRDVTGVDGQRDALAAVRDAFEHSADPGLRLEMTGPAIFAVQSKEAIELDARRLSFIAAAGVLLLLLSVYRSMRVVVLGALPLATGILAGAAAVTALWGSLHGITLAFGFSLVGVAVDYPIHLFSYAGHTGSTHGAARRLWPTLRLGLLTTVLGYSALLLSGFAGLSQLGLFSIVGLTAAAATTRWVLAPLAPRAPRARLAGTERLLIATSGLARWLPPALLAIAAVFLITEGGDVWERDLGALNPVPERQKRLDAQLRDDLGAPDVRHLLVLQGDSVDEVLQMAERLEDPLERLVAAGAMDGFELPSHYLPSVPTQEARRDRLPTAEQLEAWLTNASAGLPFREGLFAPFIRDVAESRSLAPLRPSMAAGTAIGARLWSHLRTHGDHTFGMVTLSGVAAPDALSELAAATPELTHLDLSSEAARLIGSYRAETLKLFTFGAFVIVMALFTALRHAGAVLRVVTPTAAALACSAALITATGTPLSLFHLSSLLLVLGIGLDYGLFYERLRENRGERRATATALLVCNLSTVIVFGALATSAVPVLQAIGATVALGAPLSLIFTVLMAYNDGSGEQAAARLRPLTK